MNTQGALSNAWGYEYRGLVLRFDTAGAANTAARIHDKSCQMVQGKESSRFKLVTNSDRIADEVSDLVNRGYDVTKCRCCNE
jgi:hypothetical protein